MEQVIYPIEAEALLMFVNVHFLSIYSIFAML